MATTKRAGRRPPGRGRPAKKDPSSYTMSVKIPQSWPARLKKIAARQGVTVGEVIKSSVEACYPEIGRPEEDRANWTPGGAE